MRQTSTNSNTNGTSPFTRHSPSLRICAVGLQRQLFLYLAATTKKRIFEIQAKKTLKNFVLVVGFSASFQAGDVDRCDRDRKPY